MELAVTCLVVIEASQNLPQIAIEAVDVAVNTVLRRSLRVSSFDGDAVDAVDAARCKHV